MAKIYILLLVMTILLFMNPVEAQERKPALSPQFPNPTTALFSSYEPFELKLSGPLTTLFQHKKDGLIQAKKIKVLGKISYTDARGQKIEVPVRIRLKGFSSLYQCPFPKMELKFMPEETAHTIFAGTQTVDLNTHCSELNDSSVFSFFQASYFNHREAFAYRMMDILSMPALKARPVFISYQDLDSPSQVKIRRHQPYQAFFLEDMADFRKRLGLKEIKGVNEPLKPVIVAEDPQKASQFQFKSVEESPRMDPEDVARLALFQYLVGNNDWFIKLDRAHQRNANDKNDLWNTKILETSQRKWIPIAQDFSLSVLLAIEGAAIFNEATFDAADEASQEKIKKIFLSKKKEIEKALEESLREDPQLESIKQYLNSIFSRIEEI